MSDARFLGIDFSGGAGPWRRVCAKPTVWIAALEGPRLVDLRPVQKLDGDADPFDNLVALLGEGRYRAAAIDAPFCLPEAHMPAGGHAQLLRDIAKLPAADDRPFPRGADLLAYATTHAPLASQKPARLTERQHHATRSTLWNGSRPGAPFAAACLTLLARSQRPIWPWADAPGMLVETFPAAQLKAWGLPNAGYADDEGRTVRAKIVTHLEESKHLMIAPTDRRELLRSADALDAVLAAFGAKAAANRLLKFEKPDNWKTEGAIAIHV
ncbi:MAG: DUF429 domain-containing protein [Alphaproteobacteria bacterium]|jgi:hypothetical protein|nr:MAG: DUF429 domain-containing protein [Alphaproteobacteria bacterium]